MSAMKSNGLLKFGVPVAVVLLLGMGLYAMKGTSNNNIKTNPDGTIYDLTDEERRELNLADGDTPQDTIKTLVS
ncbi:MAG: TIGR03752 family integrating conjugative element protein, partial [[Actinobacillus] rossii]|nr:TIGR03752 family integrating conjugative element protein [[Actinobacillus] rossii]